MAETHKDWYTARSFTKPQDILAMPYEKMIAKYRTEWCKDFASPREDQMEAVFSAMPKDVQSKFETLKTSSKISLRMFIKMALQYEMIKILTSQEGELSQGDKSRLSFSKNRLKKYCEIANIDPKIWAIS